MLVPGNALEFPLVGPTSQPGLYQVPPSVGERNRESTLFPQDASFALRHKPIPSQVFVHCGLSPRASETTDEKVTTGTHPVWYSIGV